MSTKKDKTKTNKREAKAAEKASAKKSKESKSVSKGKWFVQISGEKFDDFVKWWNFQNHIPMSDKKNIQNETNIT